MLDAVVTLESSWLRNVFKTIPGVSRLYIFPALPTSIPFCIIWHHTNPKSRVKVYHHIKNAAMERSMKQPSRCSMKVLLLWSFIDI
jgi:hypothetical protein